jgi:uncharacterized protein (TIRG00374 family)
VSPGEPLTIKARSTRRLAGVILRIAITVAILGYLGNKIDWSELAQRLLQSNLKLLLVACLLIGATYLIASLRWWLLLRVQEIVLPLKTAIAVTLIGQFFNAYLLGSVGGDAVKAMYLWRLAPNQKTHAALAIVMDRAVGLFVLLCFALATLPWHFQELMADARTRVVAYGLTGAFVAMLVVAAALTLIPFDRVPASVRRLWMKLPGRHILELLVGGFRRHRRHTELTLWAILCSILIYLIVFLAGWYLGTAIGIRMTYLQGLMILSVVICVISLPISIGGHGVREGAFVLLFALFGIVSIDRESGAGYETAVLYSLLFFSLSLVWSLVGGIVYLLYRSDGRDSVLAANRPCSG